MYADRPRLFVSAESLETLREAQSALDEIFEIVVTNKQASRSVDDRTAFVLMPADLGAINTLAGALQSTVEAMTLLDASGRPVWMNDRCEHLPAAVRDLFFDQCRELVESQSIPGTHNRSAQRSAFSKDESYYEVLVLFGAMNEASGAERDLTLGILCEVTDAERLQRKIDAIDAAGAELLRIESFAISHMNMAERLKLLEDKIVRCAHDLLQFENFEIRLTNQESRQLELVSNRGISPLRIGESIHAKPEDGISGYVACTGVGYLCNDTRSDSRYREGLEEARSSLTAPLKLHDRIIGVINVESTSANAFDEEDLLFAEIYGRYIAMAMHILDLLVVERFTTNEQISEQMLSELTEPLGRIVADAAMLRQAEHDPSAHAVGDRILEAAAQVRQRLEACARGPKTILGVEQELQKGEKDPRLVGRHILVADNEPLVLEAMTALLEGKGCRVTACPDGSTTLRKIRTELVGEDRPDLIISDIRMPDHNGYEVFRATREISDTLPVILITGFGYDPHHSIVRASQEGLTAFLFKPVKASQLLETVVNALENE